MIRRRRPKREIAFSFDSFLDVVANVVGIILRLILVAWMGARSYKAVVGPPPPPPAALAAEPDPSPPPDPTDPRLERIEQERVALAGRAAAQQRDKEQQRRRVLAHEEELNRLLIELASKRQALQAEEILAGKQATRGKDGVRAVQMSLVDLEKRSKALLAELDTLRRQPRAVKTLRYRTPLSAPVQTEEVTFECQNGRVTLVEVGRMLEEARSEARARSKDLQSRWEVTGTTTAAGAFRMRFLVERERDVLDAGGSPGGGSYRYGLTAWEIEPVQLVRGETLAEALKQGSAFRKVIDALDPQESAITLWVYPDSFALYRAIRDHLHGRDFVVAGRPLPHGASIAASRKGTVSQGQ
jgi:hypothetical protein